MEFNQEQENIINKLEGAYIISAPVGTGKTTILAERVIKALKEGFKPEEILCLTFTNRAAEEMSSRIKSQVDKNDFAKLTIKTFHGFCAYLIKEEAKQLDISPDFVIFEEEEQVEIMKDILDRHPGYISNQDNANKDMKELLERIYEYRLRSLEKEIGCELPEFKAEDEFKKIADEYARALLDQNALDFNELVLVAIKALYNDKKIRQKWSSRYRFVQLDEFQDTHLSEYMIVKELSKVAGNVSFIGDLDQTIYGWRGSRPYLIRKLIKSHFPKVEELSLKINYRFNPNLLEAVKSFLASFERKNTKDLESSEKGGEENRCIEVFAGHNFQEEIDWVINNIQDIKKVDKDARVAVLARANWLIGKASEIFGQKGIAHITVDKYEFFRRQEVKDIFAYLKIVFNRFDLESAYRLIRRPARGIGEVAMKEIRDKGLICGLKVSDFLNFRNFNYPEPFFDLINRWDKGRIIVLDTETTGTDTLYDEVIQVFAIEIINGQPGREFYHLLKSTRPVGSSEDIHGISDEHLAKNGRDAREVLSELKNFIANDPCVGHNVNFDITMLAEHGKRLGVDFAFRQYYDTLDMARRKIEAPNYRLGTLAEILDLETATHDARDDVMATVGLLGVLIDKFRKDQSARKDLFARYSPKFIALAGLINSWQEIVKVKRPADALQEIWKESGLLEYYSEDKERETRFQSIKNLVELFKEKDEAEKASELSLRELIRFAALVRDINFLGLDQGRIPIVTAHQVKGLEFDYVFVVGLNEYMFPIYKSDLEEEKRLFYVAMTRARKRVFLSYSRFKDNGLPMNRSPFISYLDDKYINFSNQ